MRTPSTPAHADHVARRLVAAPLRSSAMSSYRLRRAALHLISRRLNERQGISETLHQVLSTPRQGDRLSLFQQLTQQRHDSPELVEKMIESVVRLDRASK